MTKFSDLNRYFIGLFPTLILISEFIIGLFAAITFTNGIVMVYFLVGIGLFIFQIIIIIRSSFRTLSFRKKMGVILIHSLNSLFSFVIGFTIPLLESNIRHNFGIVMLPLLIILSFIITDKYYKDTQEIEPMKSKPENNQETNRPVIEFEGKRFIFSNQSLISLAIGAPVLALLIYYFFDWEQMYWLHEIVVKQTVYFLNLFFNIGADTAYSPEGIYHWSFVLDPGNIYFETFCTGIQAICVFAGIIIFIPHSQDKETSKDIIWRKAKSLVISSIIFYIVNIIRMLIQIELYNIGYPWDSIHVSISAASSFIAAIIILLLHRWIPEFIISIIYIGTLFKRKIRKKTAK